MIRSYQRVLTKCMTPAKTKNGPKSLLTIAETLWTERRPRLGDAEPLLLERTPDDHSLDVAQAEACDRPQVLERSDPARIDHLGLGRLRNLPERVEVGALHQPVDLARRVDEPAQPAARELGDHVSRAEIGRLRPALRRDLSRACVHGGDHAIAVHRRQRLRKVGITDGCGAEDDSRGSGRKRLLDLLRIAQTT